MRVCACVLVTITGYDSDGTCTGIGCDEGGSGNGNILLLCGDGRFHFVVKCQIP